jgi:hypothetical protein
MRKLGEMKHDECAPWCDHDPAHHAEDCNSAFCAQECWDTPAGKLEKIRKLIAGCKDHTLFKPKKQNLRLGRI